MFETNAVIQGRRPCKTGSEAGVGKGTVVTGREGTVPDMEGEPGQVPEMPRGKRGAKQL